MSHHKLEAEEDSDMFDFGNANAAQRSHRGRKGPRPDNRRTGDGEVLHIRPAHPLRANGACSDQPSDQVAIRC